MATQWIPSFHFRPAAEKLTPEFCQEVIDYCYRNTENKSLLDGKDVEEIEAYAAGDFSVAPFLKMFKSMAKKEQKRRTTKGIGEGNDFDEETLEGIKLSPLPLIPTKLDSAVSIVQKIPVEPSVNATDSLAARKKKEDVHFLKTKPQVEEQLQEVADMMNLPAPDLGATKHSSVKYGSAPYGLNLNDPEEEDAFVNVIYTLGIEAAYETVLQHWYSVKKADQKKLLKIRDQYKFGVSCHQSYPSAITGLPDLEYVHPKDLWTPPSLLPDHSDNPHRFIEKGVTAMEAFNLFGSSMKEKDFIEKVLNDKVTGYCKCNNMQPVDAANWGSTKVTIVEFEVKSVDWVGVIKRGGKRGGEYLTTEDVPNKIWGQNTYQFIWLKNTNHFFNITRLTSAHRTEGQEAYQGFSTDIYKSKERSAVELSIGENKKAMVAEVKLIFHLLKALPSGKYIDLRFVRGALAGLKEMNKSYAIDDVVDLALEKNVIIGDTSNFGGKADAQLVPFREIVGGVKREEIAGYFEVIERAEQNISRFTGINDQLTGQSANAEGLIGLQKLLINSSLNALYYCNEGISSLEQSLLTQWASIIKQAVEAGGKARKAIEDIIGADKTNIIDELPDLPLHTIGIRVNIAQREEERQHFENRLGVLMQDKTLNASDEFQLRNIRNPKDQMAMLAVKEKAALRRQQQQQQQLFAHQQQLAQQQGQNLVQAQQAKTQGNIQEIAAQGEVQAKITQLASQLGITSDQYKAIGKMKIQQDRNQAGIDKAISVLQTKNNLQQQESLI